jgi:uroporphyrinogen III methyltransferase/synthase
MSINAKPLDGKRIVVTRAPEQASELVAALQDLGAEFLSMPTVEFARADSPEHDFSRVVDCEWILFTSQNAVRFFAEIVVENFGQERATEIFSQLKAGAVGPTTAEAARRSGFRMQYVAKVHTGEGLAQELAGELKGKRVLVPRSDRADGRFSNALREAGAEVNEFVAYRTAAPKSVDENILRRVRNAEVDAVIFASPSAFHNLGAWIPADALAELSKRTQFVAIGPTTARALRDAGAQVAIEASDASAPALADAIVSYYEKHPTAARRA